MMTVSHYMYKQRTLSEADIRNLSWRGLAVQHVEWLGNVSFWKKAVAQRKKRNTEPKRPNHPDLMNRETWLRVAQLNEHRLRTEIQRREEGERQAAFSASLKRMAAKVSRKNGGGNVLRFCAPLE